MTRVLLAVVLLCGMAPSPAFADRDDHHGHRRGRHDHHDYDRHRYREHYYRPRTYYYQPRPEVYYYAPPPVYAPPRPPSFGLNLVFPFHFD